MPRVYAKTKNRAGAVRTCGFCQREIRPGEKYYSWSFRYGGTYYRCSEHYPKRSDLTQSKMGDVYAAIEGAEVELSQADSVQDIADILTEVREIVENVASEYEEAAEYFGGEGENQERAEELESWGSELDSFYPNEEDDLQDIRSQAEEVLTSCPL